MLMIIINIYNQSKGNVDQSLFLFRIYGQINLLTVNFFNFYGGNISF
ncbi:hypothetical protein SAMN05216516_109112 [Izhakiella capsodis]|uniref:Uncharacterized protein n=1 Tax=Izhakiella capsodis TaxID=1367852 RepID=A0A1I4ZRX8_9GAMM|nr:hypothetical protein SAMN05216516_109112 [Izhakiella capsodis]